MHNGGRSSVPMRIAWLGPTPSDDAGVSYMAGQLMRAWSEKGVEVDAFLDANLEELPSALASLPGISYHGRPTGWRYERWYSKTAFTKFATGLGARAFGQLRLVRDVARAHADRPYDVLYQFSHFEAAAVRPFAHQLPPLVLHPETHIAGELRWHRIESGLSARCEPRAKRLGVRAVLVARAAAQRRDAHLARRLIAPSAVFRDAVARDYAIPRDRFRVVPNPIDLERYRPSPDGERDGPLRILMVSRIAVRKGVELTVALAHRLHDLEGRIRIEVIGDRALWSDYRLLLADLPAAVGTYLGQLPGGELASTLRDADLLVQPSHYEPFALTVGEALASGVPVVASDAVGAAEFVDGAAVRRFQTGDLDDYERAVRAMVAELEAPGGRERLRREARAQAERAFSRPAFSASLESALAGL